MVQISQGPCRKRNHNSMAPLTDPDPYIQSWNSLLPLLRTLTQMIPMTLKVIRICPSGRSSRLTKFHKLASFRWLIMPVNSIHRKSSHHRLHTESSAAPALTRPTVATWGPQPRRPTGLALFFLCHLKIGRALMV
jgi:hypothetical protein